MLSHHQLTQLQQHGIVHPNPYVSTQHHKYGVSQRSKQPAPAVVVEGASQLPEGQRPTQQSLGGAGSYAAVGSGGWNSTRRGYGVGGAQQQETQQHQRRHHSQQQRASENPLSLGRNPNIQAAPLNVSTAQSKKVTGSHSAAPSDTVGPPPPPPPPPVLTTEQQEHLREMLKERQATNRRPQVHERSASWGTGGVVGETSARHGYTQIRVAAAGGAATGGAEGGVGYRGPPRPPSPSRTQFQLHQQQHQQHQQRVTSSGHHQPHHRPHAGPPTPVACYPNMAIAIPSPRGMGGTVSAAPSPVVPVYASLSEALFEQRKQQQARALAHQLQQHTQHQHVAAYHQTKYQNSQQPQQDGVGGNGGGGGRVGHAAATSMPPLPVPPGTAGGGVPLVHTGPDPHHLPKPPPKTCSDDHARQHVRQQHPSSAPYPQHGQPSPSLKVPRQAHFFQGPLQHQSMPSPAARRGGAREQMVAVAAAAAAAGGGPATPLHVLPPGQPGSASAPTTPAMVYAYPHGYMMAYTQPHTPQHTVAPQSLPGREANMAWNPYECVSPAGEVPASRQGFSRSNTDRPQQAAPSVVSREGSPDLSTEDHVAAVSVTSKDSAQTNWTGSTQTRSRASSNVSDLIDRGFDEDSEVAATATSTTEGTKRLPEPLKLEDDRESVTSVFQVSPPETPVTKGKERTRASGSVGVLGDGKKDSSSAGSAESTPEKQLSGKKRGGDAIEKQKSFTGSYFQVSPASFLQPSKRQRGPSYDNSEEADSPK